MSSTPSPSPAPPTSGSGRPWLVILSLVLLAGIFIASFAVPPRPERAALSPQPTSDSGTAELKRPGETMIAYASVLGPNLEIYVMNADGSNQTRLTP